MEQFPGVVHGYFLIRLGWAVPYPSDWRSLVSWYVQWAFIFGFLYRLAMIPMIFTMIVAFFVIHANDVFAVKELAFIYLVVFVLMYIAGPGKFSIDHFIGNKLAHNKRK